MCGIFENEIFLELWRNKRSADSLLFYRTQSGTEVDFVIDGSTRKLAVECKYRRFDKPVSIASLNYYFHSPYSTLWSLGNEKQSSP